MKKTLSIILLATAVVLLAGIIFLAADIITQKKKPAERSVSESNTSAAIHLQETAAQAEGNTAQDEKTVSGTQNTSPEATPEVTPEQTQEQTAEASGADDAQTASKAEPAASQAETVAAANPDQTDDGVLYAATTVNIRSEPNTESTVLGQLSSGAKVVKTGEADDWTQFEYNGSTAYVKTEFLTADHPTLKTDWNLSELSTESVNFGYSSANRDERNVPTDWEYYDQLWGQFAVKWIGDTSKNVIYLTMDEGFPNENTITILQTLKEKGVHITFFLTKNFVDGKPDLVQQMIDDGHQLGNHTCTHPDMTSLSVEDQTSQIMTLHDIIKDQFGYEMKYFRFPMGIFSSETLGLVNNLGYETVFWSYAYGDYDTENQPPVDESLQKALDALHPGAIYLLHADSDTNMTMLGDFIDGARERGFEFGELAFLE